MNEQRCPRCDQYLPEDSFTPSKRRSICGSSGAWCKSCMSTYYKLKNNPELPLDIQERLCAECGSQFTPKVRRAAVRTIYCSRECKARARNASIAEATFSRKPDRQCLHCGSDMPKAMRIDAKFCSAECNGRAHALQRKLRARAGQDEKPGYLRAEICKRDKWRCGICMQRVDRLLRYPHPMAASLDHVIPVSEGGDSSPANLRLTHLVCNLRRRNVGGNEQLALI